MCINIGTLYIYIYICALQQYVERGFATDKRGKKKKKKTNELTERKKRIGSQTWRSISHIIRHIRLIWCVASMEVPTLTSMEAYGSSGKLPATSMEEEGRRTRKWTKKMPPK